MMKEMMEYMLQQDNMSEENGSELKKNVIRHLV